MPQVRVSLYATLRKHVDGAASLDVEIEPGATVAERLEQHGQQRMIGVTRLHQHLSRALAATGPNARWGITIALVHFLFNLCATLLIYPFQRIREIPLNAARRLSAIAVESRKWALVYVLVLFYGIPLLFAAINHFLD